MGDDETIGKEPTAADEDAIRIADIPVKDADTLQEQQRVVDELEEALTATLANVDPWAPPTDEHRWGEAISPERREVLDARLRQWANEHKPLVDSKPPSSAFDRRGEGAWDGNLTGADVFYLAARALIGDPENQQEVFLVANSLNLRRAQEDRQWRLRLDLSGLSLTGAYLGAAHLEGADLAGAHLEDTDLDGAHLEGAYLRATHLERAALDGAHLEHARLFEANLEGSFLLGSYLSGAYLSRAYLGGSYLREAHLEDANLRETYLEVANLNGASLEGADLHAAHLEGAELVAARLQRADLEGAHLEKANLREAHLEYAALVGANLEGASLREAHLEGASLERAHLEGKTMAAEDLIRIRHWRQDFPDHLPPADLQLAFLNEGTTLNEIILGTPEHGYVRVADARWGGANLAVVTWPRRLVPPQVVLGDERIARDPLDIYGKAKSPADRLAEYRTAVRANRQLAVALQEQGLNEESARFSYAAHVLQRNVLRREQSFGAYFFSLLVLAALAGYGYRIKRIFLAYGLVVTAFAAGYFLTSQASSGMMPTGSAIIQGILDAFQISLNAIHGRVFFAQFGLDTLQSWFATLESIMGIIIEGVFVAMLIQRFFGR